MDKVKSVTDNNQGQLISQFGLLQEVLDTFWVVAVALTANSLHFLDLSCFTSGLDVLEVYIRILTEVNNRSQEVE